ncbi:chemotaxis protein CheW [Pseudidiomarina marina]|uniref:chemotaxis protein CheW n=1 Tax=Pseudidiomarina marina TaxID=502366 RepID=UPI00384D0629
MLPFQLAAQQFAVPLDHIIRVIPMLLPTQLPGAPDNIAGVVSVHGQVLPVVDLAQTCRQPELKVDLWTPMIWLHTSKRELLIPVASVGDILQVEPEQFIEGSHASINSSMLNGVLSKADQLLIIMDIDALLSAEDDAQLHQALTDYLDNFQSQEEEPL